jgi:polysaccharide biosynthesis transport protein
MPLQRFAAILRGRWRTAAAVWVGTVAFTILAAFLSGAQYKAVAMVMVEPKIVDPAAGITLPGTMPNHIPTEIDVIQSERVALRALHAVNLQTSEVWRNRWKEATQERGDFEAWLAEQLLKKFDVKPSRESNVLTLAFTSTDPAFAAQLANAFTRAYMETSLELRTDPARESNTVFDENSKRLRSNLEQAQRKLSDFQQKAGLVATDERFDVENMRLLELSSQVVTLQAAAANAAGRERQGSLHPESMQEVQKDLLVASLAAELAKQEGRLVELSSRLGTRHPTVIELRDSIGELRARAAQASRRAAASIVTEKKVADERLAEAQQSLQAQRVTVLRLKAQRDQATVLQRELENAQRAYDAVLTRSSQTAMESRGARPNVSVLKVATPPALPSWPKPWIVVGAASVIGLLLAIAVVLMRETSDIRLRSLDDVTDRLGQPVLAVLRGPRAALGQPRREKLALQQS